MSGYHVGVFCGMIALIGHDYFKEREMYIMSFLCPVFILTFGVVFLLAVR